MKNIILVCTLTFLIFAACKKDSKKQFSTWSVNSKDFSTNEVESSIGKAIARLGSGNHDNQNYFRLGFKIGYFPTEGRFKLQYDDPNSSFSGISFYYDGGFYLLSPYTENYLTASLSKGKACYTLPDTWFVNYDNQNDSVLIHGIFIEP